MKPNLIKLKMQKAPECVPRSIGKVSADSLDCV